MGDFYLGLGVQRRGGGVIVASDLEQWQFPKQQLIDVPVGQLWYSAPKILVASPWIDELSDFIG